MENIPPQLPQPPQNANNEQAMWVPAQPSNGQPPVAVQVQKKGMPWWGWALIGCGGFFFLFLILIVVVIVAINPVQRINEAQGRANQALVHTVSTSVQTCISAEKAKGANNELIFSVEKCANPAYLVQSKYSTQAIPETIKISANTTNSKICVYTNSSLSASQAATNSTLVSWDSDREIISQPGEGTTVCN